MIIACPQCNGLNRVPDGKVSEQPKCAKCKALLFTGQVLDLTSDNFIAHSQKSELPLVVDFWASWCGPCQQFAPIFNQVASRKSTQFRFGKINTEQQQALAAQFNIRSIPTLMIIKQGTIVVQQAGALPQSAFEQWLNSH